MKKIILLILASAICTSSFAQRKLKYKDIYDAIGKEPSEHSFLKLKEYQSIMPEYPNTYVQSALIQWKWLQEDDPFLHYNNVLNLAYNTKLYLNLAIDKIKKDDREVKKNKVYYTNIGLSTNADELEQQAVIDHLSKLSDNVIKYETNVKKIISNFNQTIEKYNECIEIFKSIVAQQNNYKKLLVSNTQELRTKLNTLAQNYDSVGYYFTEFKTALGNYPIKNYNQETKEIPINTYRLEGLTSSNFINQEIPIWNYRQWVKEALDVMNGNINTLKNDSEKEIKKLRNQVTNLQKANAETDSIQEITPTNKTVNLVEKYDYESLLSYCLRYEAAIANLQVASMRSANNTQNQASYNDDYIQKANYYYDLHVKANTCYNYLADVIAHATDNNIELHQQSINSLYKNADNFKNNFVNNQKNEIAKIEAQNIENFKIYTVDQYAPNNCNYTHNGKNISAKPSNTSFADAQVGTYVTTYTCKDHNGNRYICGYIKTSANTSNGFVAKASSANTIAWFKDINAAAGGANSIIQVIPSKFAGIAVIAANTNANAVKSTAIKLDNDGKQIAKVDFATKSYPTACLYDEINENITAVLKGNTGNENATTKESATIETIDLTTKSSSVIGTFAIAGKIADIIKADANYITICNFTELEVNNQKLSSKSGIASICANTDKISATALDTNKEARAIKAFQVNAETICITGAYDNLNTETSSDETPAYLLLNNNGQFIYKN